MSSSQNDMGSWKFAHGPVVRTLHFHQQRPRFDPRGGELDSTSHAANKKEKSKQKDMESGLGPLKPHPGHSKLASADLNHQNCHKNIHGLN